MKTYLDTLRPTEKRLVVIVASALFVVLNYAFVFPYFSDLEKVRQRMLKAHRTLETYKIEVQKIPFYTAEVTRMTGDSQDVPTEDQAAVFTTTVLKQAAASGVSIMGSSTKPTTRTNQFFLELSQVFSVESTEEQLVNFLYNLGSKDSLIRVRDLGLHPNAPRYQLNATIKLVASYQKKSAAKSGTPSRTASAAGASTTSSRP